MKQVSSPDIQVIDFSVLMDISGTAPVLTAANLSSIANNASALKWVFELYSPSGTTIYKGDFTTPDRATGWSDDFVVNTNFPRPFNQIEWSGSPYRFVVRVKDTDGTIHEHSKSIRVCRPKGLDDKCNNTYGKASITVVSKCHLKKVWFEDKTNYTYNGKTATPVSKVLKLAYPPDETGTSPETSTFNNFNSVLVPVTQSGPGYQYIYNSVMAYDYGDHVTVRIKYLARESFQVNCNINLTPLACELKKLIDRVESKSCTNCSEDQKLITIVSAKLHLASISMLYPQSGLDPYKIVDEIKDITGWQCECCPTGMDQLDITDTNGMSYDFVKDGGDVEGYWEINGSTITLHMSDYSYEFAMCPQEVPGAAAFEVIPSIDGYTKKYCLKVHQEVLANDVLNTIRDNTTLKNLFLDLVNANGAGGIKVDPKCLNIVGDTGSQYSYIFTSPVLLANQTIFLKWVVYIDENGVEQKKSIHYVWERTNSLEAATVISNVLGEGWEVQEVDGNKMVITHEASSKNMVRIEAVRNRPLEFGINFDFTMTKTKIEGGSVLAVENILQALIDAVCLNIISTEGGHTLVIKLLLAIQGGIDNINITPEDSLQEVLSKFVDAYNKLVQIVHDIKPTDCALVKEIFSTEDTDGLIDSDRFLMFSAAGCRIVSPKFIALKILKDAQNDPDVKGALCAAIAACAKPICNPVTNATASYDASTQVLTAIITNTGAEKYQASYIKAGVKGGTLEPKIVVAADGLTTTITWENVLPGAYDIYIIAICTDGSKSGEYIITTSGCLVMTNFNVVYDAVNNKFTATWSGVPANATHVRIEVLYPNGGNFAQNYDKALGEAHIPVPSGVTGNFTIIGRAVCSVDYNWYSDPRPPIQILIQTPSACPVVSKAEVISLVGTTATIRITKPVPATGATSYTLHYAPNFGGSAQSMTLNSASEVVDFELTGLIAGATYTWYVLTNCTKQTSERYQGIPFTINDDDILELPANNSSVTNNGDYPAKWVTVMINGTTVFAGGVQAPTEVKNFITGEYNNATVKLTPCNAGATDATLVIGPFTKHVSFIENIDGNETFVFTNVTLSGGVGMDLAWTSETLEIET